MGKVIKTLYLTNGQFKLEQAELASKYLNEGGVVALPTDTIYGIAAKADNKLALDRLYSIKGRDLSKPLAICVSDIESIADVAETRDIESDLLAALLPGPVTVLLKRSPNLNPYLNPGVQTVGIRVPDHNFISTVCKLSGTLALTSANRSGKPSTCSVEEFQDLIPELDCTFDCGQSRSARIGTDCLSSYEPGSTVIDLTRPGVYGVLRQGQGFNRAKSVLEKFGYQARPKHKN